MRRYPAEALPLKGERVLLSEETSHHLLIVCLTPRGTELKLFDGQGRGCRVRLTGVSGSCAEVEGLSDPQQESVTEGATVIVGLPKKPALERAIRMGTELGIKALRLFPARHSSLRNMGLKRLERVAEEAARQSGRSDAPLLSMHESMEEALRDLAEGPRWILHPGGPAKRMRHQTGATLLVGPEGGWHAEELACAEARGFEPCSISHNILRVDTAIVAALAILGAG